MNEFKDTPFEQHFSDKSSINKFETIALLKSTIKNVCCIWFFKKDKVFALGANSGIIEIWNTV